MREEKDQKLAERNIPGMMNRGQRFAEVQHAQNSGAALRRIAVYFAKERGMVAAMLAVVIFGTLCGIYAPGLQSNAIDSIAKNRTGNLGRTLLLMTAVYLIYSAGQLLQGLIGAQLSQRIVKQMREELFGKLMDLPVRSAYLWCLMSRTRTRREKASKRLRMRKLLSAMCSFLTGRTVRFCRILR